MQIAHAEEEAENASNPLAKVKNTDFRWKYFDLDGPERNDYFLDGAFMLSEKFKVKYELHFWDTDVTGKDESDWERLKLIGIYFPPQAMGAWGQVKYKGAFGLEWDLDMGDRAKGIGTGSDQLAPFVGVALMPQPGTTLIPLVQHFLSYNGDAINTTGFRLIAIQRLPNKFWLKLDAIAPVDWQHDDTKVANAELQFGKTFTKNVGAYVDLLTGIGGDKPYEWGVGTGLRVSY